MGFVSYENIYESSDSFPPSLPAELHAVSQTTPWSHHCKKLKKNVNEVLHAVHTKIIVQK